MDTYRLLILGEVYELGSVLPLNGLDYINIVDTRDGYTDRQFETIKPLEISQVVKVNSEAVLVTAEYSGVVRWNTRDMYGEDWRFKMETPKYIAVGPSGRAVTVANDGLDLTLLDIEDGTLVLNAKLDSKAIGNPVFISGQFYIPVVGGVAVLDGSLAEKGMMQIKGLDGSGDILPFGGGAYLVTGTDTYWFDI